MPRTPLRRLFATIGRSKSSAVRPLCGWAAKRNGFSIVCCRFASGAWGARALWVRGKLGPAPADPNTLDDIGACLRRIQKSIDFWNKSNGRQGYLSFVTQYVA